jgi:hypothetical protein
MRRFSEQQKSEAAVNQEKAGRIAIVAGFFTAAIAAVPGPGPLLALAPAAVGAAYGNRSIAQGRIVRDPPDSDFRTPTELGQIELDVSALGDSPLARPAGYLAFANERAAAAGRAMVRAAERTMGAELADAEEYVGLRLAEADGYAEQFSEALRSTSEGAIALMRALPELPPVQPIPFREPLVLEELLPDETLAGLYRARVRRSYVHDPLTSQTPAWRPDVDPAEQFAESLAEMAEADRDYADAIEYALRTESLLVT